MSLFIFTNYKLKKKQFKFLANKKCVIKFWKNEKMFLNEK